MEKIYKRNEIASKLIVRASAHTMLLRSDGRVRCVESALLIDREAAQKYDKGQTLISLEHNIIGVAANYLTSFALLKDGTVRYEGEYFDGIENVSELTDVKQIACGTEHFVALKNDGTVVAYGSNDYGQCSVMVWRKIKKIICGMDTTFGIKEDGTVVACGNNRCGECEVSDWTDIISVTPAFHFTFGVKADGTLVYCGDIPKFTKEYIKNWKDVVSIDCGGCDDSKFIALKKDGTVLCCDKYGNPEIVSEWSGMVAAFSGDGAYLGIKEDGNVVAVNNMDYSIFDNEASYKNMRLFEDIDNIEAEREIKFAEEEERIEELKRSRKREARRKVITKASAIASVFLIIGLVACYIFVIAPKSKYNKALELAKNGNTHQAYTLFYELGDYKDSIKQCKKIQWKKLKTGDVVYLGKYEQDNDTENGKEDVEWIVLSKKDGKALLLSKYILMSKEYEKFKRDKWGNYKVEDVTWANSDMREWLNGTFYKKVFSKKESERIITTELSNEDNSKYNTNGGADTKDKMFLLSVGQAKKYFPNDSDRKAKGTKYYKSKLDFSDRVRGRSHNWWLRTPGKYDSYVAAVDKSGEIDKAGYSAALLSLNDAGADGVRPAMWVKIK